MIRYDETKESLFSPQNLGFSQQISKCLLVFDDEIWNDVILQDSLFETVPVINIHGREFNSYRLLSSSGQNILLACPATGASASAMELEMLIASGIDTFLSFGTCGRLDPNMPQNTLIIPTEALREEGVSYHYLPDANYVEQNADYVQSITNVFTQKNLPFITGKVWTTDAIYRETKAKVDLVRGEGCIAVDMELSALLSVTKFRNVKFSSFLIADDAVVGESAQPLKRNNQQILQAALEIIQAL